MKKTYSSLEELISDLPEGYRMLESFDLTAVRRSPESTLGFYLWREKDGTISIQRIRESPDAWHTFTDVTDELIGEK